MAAAKNQQMQAMQWRRLEAAGEIEETVAFVEEGVGIISSPIMSAST